MTMSRYIAVISYLLILYFILPLPIMVNADSSAGYFEYLQKRLVKDGFDKNRIKNIYNTSQVYFDTEHASLFFRHSEARLNYNQFTSVESIQRAQEYMHNHIVELAWAEREYGVDKEIITAIILVESNLGKTLGKSSVLNTLSTIASLSDSGLRVMLWDKIQNPGRLSRKDFEKKAQKKSKWAYKELKAFIKYTEREKMDSREAYGSYAGAMGIAQFMPSNILKLAKDGNKDGRIDLYNHTDAMASIANYLKHYGWHPEIDRKKAYKVLYHYNHSSYYVDTLLMIAKLLKS